MFRVKRVFGGRTLLGFFIAIGAITLLFASYLVGASIGHAQTTTTQNTIRASVAGNSRTTQSPTATPTTVATASSNTVVVVVTPTTVPTTPGNTVAVTSTPTVSTTTNTTPTATPVDTANSSIDQLPTDLSYQCNRVEYLGGKWPVHLYIGGCLVKDISQYSWAIDSIKNVLNTTVCAGNQICVIAVDVTAYFLHNEIQHIVAESNKCGGNGVYVHVFGAFFRTHPVC